MTSDEDTRPQPPSRGDEKDTLLGFLNFHRATLAWKCAGMTDDQLRARPIATTTLSLLGLVRHLADVERGWMREAVLGQTDLEYHFSSPDNRDGDFNDVDTADVGAAWAAWRTEAAHTDEVFAARDLDDTFTSRGETGSLRWLLGHLVEEYARHVGHADLLAEAIDGRTGE